MECNFPSDSGKLVIDAYVNNNLEDLNLPYTKAPDQLNLEERGRLLDLSHKVLETAILSEYGLKSFENYENYKICEKNLQNIGKAYNVSKNTSNILSIENTPNLKELFIPKNWTLRKFLKFVIQPQPSITATG